MSQPQSARFANHALRFPARLVFVSECVSVLRSRLEALFRTRKVGKGFTFMWQYLSARELEEVRVELE